MFVLARFHHPPPSNPMLMLIIIIIISIIINIIPKHTREGSLDSFLLLFSIFFTASFPCCIHNTYLTAYQIVNNKKTHLIDAMLCMYAYVVCVFVCVFVCFFFVYVLIKKG